ncbi:MAG: TrmH family RNA methyltransferase [Anaerovoracaceae bacterium]
MIKRITSVENPTFKEALKLRYKHERDRRGVYLAEGPNLLHEGLKNDVFLKAVFLSEDLSREENNRIREMVERRGHKGKLIVLEHDLFRRISDTETPQGVISIIEKRKFTEGEFFVKTSDRGWGNILVIDRIQDPGNMGTLLRTSDAAGWSGIMIVKGTVDIYSPKVVRAAAGSLFRVPILFVRDGEEALNLLRKHGKRILVTDPRSNTCYYDVDMRENIALIIGNEGSGISKDFMAGGDCMVTLPMAEAVESLNAAVAAGILMYESLRQNNENRNKGEKQVWGRQI